MVKATNKIGYSPGERKVLELLPEAGSGQATSTEITQKFYGGNGRIPFHGRKIVMGLIRSAEKKAKHNKEAFRIAATKRSGPHAISFWIERKGT